MKYLFWDIDGTLLLTGGAGANAMLEVIKEHYFLKDFKFNKPLAGRTDPEIIKEAVKQIKGRCSAADAASLLIRYHMLLPEYLKRYQGAVLKNVQETLEYFSKPELGYKNCLLTGNTKTGAKFKLAHYGLDKYFDFDASVFGELSEDRRELAKIAWQRFYAQNPAISTDDFIFIGDTPNDVICAQAIDARCLVVLWGSHYQKEDFAPVQPWKIIDFLPDQPEQLQKLFEEN